MILFLNSKKLKNKFYSLQNVNIVYSYNYTKYVGWYRSTIKTNLKKKISYLNKFLKKKNRQKDYKIKRFYKFIKKKRRLPYIMSRRRQQYLAKISTLTKQLVANKHGWLIESAYANKFGIKKKKKKGKKRPVWAEKKIAANKLAWTILFKRRRVRSYGFRGFWKNDKSGDIVFGIISTLCAIFYYIFFDDNDFYIAIDWLNAIDDFFNLNTHEEDLNEFFNLKENPFELKNLFNLEKITDNSIEDDEDTII